MGHTKQYNYCLDFIKGVACIFVVFMHCEFPGTLGVAVQAISRFCVPFFFMVSGYFCYKPLSVGECLRDSRAIKKKIIHIGTITLYASLFYLALVLLQYLVLHNQDFTITWRNLFIWVLFNQPTIIAGQYWFLFALLYAYILYGILEHFKLRKFSYMLAAIMFVVYILMAQGMHLLGIHIPNFIYRNWLIETFPFFMLGHWIRENKPTLSNKTLILIIVISTLLCCLKRYLLGRDFGVNIITIPQVFALFIYAVLNPKRHEGAVQRLGRDCSMLVYIFHPAVMGLLGWCYNVLGLSGNVPALYIKPVLVVIISIVMALIFNSFMSFVKSRNNNVKI